MCIVVLHGVGQIKVCPYAWDLDSSIAPSWISAEAVTRRDRARKMARMKAKEMRRSLFCFITNNFA